MDYIIVNASVCVTQIMTWYMCIFTCVFFYQMVYIHRGGHKQQAPVGYNEVQYSDMANNMV